MPADGDGASTSVRLIATDPALGLICERFSPNQKWISFLAVDSARGVSTVYVMPADGGPRTAITDGAWYDDKPRWSRDGRTLLFISNRGGLLNLWGRRVDPESGMPAGELFRLTAFDDLRRALPASLSRMEIAVSGARIFLPLVESTSRLWILDSVDR
jgi:dipeptidyl aminopeptidase/acylaminoacyl peptidase